MLPLMQPLLSGIFLDWIGKQKVFISEAQENFVA